MNQELVDYIKKAKEQGKSDEEIKEDLLSTGWKEIDIEPTLTPTEDRPYETKKAIKYSFIIGISIFFLSVIFAVFNAESFIGFLYIWGLSLFILFYIIWLPVSALMYVGYLQKKKSVFLAYLFFLLFLAIYAIIFFYSWIFLLSPRSDFPLLIQEVVRLFPRMIFGLMPMVLVFYFFAKGEELIKKKFGQRYWKWVIPVALLFLLIYPIRILFSDIFIRDESTSNNKILGELPFGGIALTQLTFGRLTVAIPDYYNVEQEYEYRGSTIQKLIGPNEIISFIKIELKKEIKDVNEAATTSFDAIAKTALDQISSKIQGLSQSYSANTLSLVPNKIPGKMLEIFIINDDTRKSISNRLMIMMVDDQNRHLYILDFANLDSTKIVERTSLYKNIAWSAFFAD